MAGFPIFVEVGHVAPLIVGGGELALIKARLLLKRASVVDVAAKEVCAGLRQLSDLGAARLLPANADEPVIRGRPMVISATADIAQDTRISQIARALGVPVNVPDQPKLSSFTLPAIIDRGTVTVAIGTEGAAPALATRLRAWLESELHPRLGRLADVARTFRERVAVDVPDARSRRRFWERIFDGPAANAILEGEETKGRLLLEVALSRARSDSKPSGQVTLVGAGPGAADLLTMRAIRALKSADIIVHDGLMGDAVLDHARREAKLVSVAKSRGRHTRTQAEINALLIALAREGNHVVRLKGGDPSIFGRVGEEIDALQTAGIPLQVVPGITAAAAAAASLQIPLTHRDAARTLVFLSGHGAKNGTLELDDIDLEALAGKPVTLAVYMGLATASQLARELIRRGWSAAIPVATISRITQDAERRVLTSLDRLADGTPLEGLSGPALLIIGEVASLNPAGFALDVGSQLEAPLLQGTIPTRDARSLPASLDAQ